LAQQITLHSRSNDSIVKIDKIATNNVPAAPAPKLILPLQHLSQPKNSTSPKMQVKRNSEEELREILNWA
jgi:hypothetical protein